MSKVRVLNIVLLTALTVLGGVYFFQDELARADRKILFVGNSFLFDGDVPRQVRLMAASAKDPVDYHTRMIAKPNYRLAQHVEEGHAASELRSGVWDAVVIQEYSGGTFDPGLLASFKKSAAVLAALARANGTEVIYYAHWPPGPPPAAHRADRVAWVERHYGEVGELTGGQVAKVGAAFVAAWSGGMDGLIDEDGHHASLKGSHAAGLVVLGALGDVSPVDVRWTPLSISEDEAVRLREIAEAFGADQKS